MKWKNSQNPDILYNLEESIFKNVFENNGLLVPDHIPVVDTDFLNNIENYNQVDICIYIMKLYFADDLPNEIIESIVKESITFDCPLRIIQDKLYICELFKGPTMAFKDYGARIMSKIFNYFYKKDTRVIVATSGDTGAAVGNAFSNTNVPVTIFYPHNKITKFQKKQITTNNPNISCVEVFGDFDQCQKIVKYLLNLKKIGNTRLTTANSINICRLIPQIFYYFINYSKLKKYNQSVNFVIPSGNLGNATACVMAKKMGLPIDKIIIACNSNSVIPEYINTGIFTPRSSIKTISNAMDIGNPSNFERIHYFYDRNIENIRKDIISNYITDFDTANCIKYIYNCNNYLLDPHTAVGYCSYNMYNMYNNHNDDLFVINATASPYKFKQILDNILYPDSVKLPDIFKKILIKKSYNVFMKSKIDIYEKLLKTRTIILIGMPGSGKSSIGKYLRKHNFNWIDTDKLIEKQHNSTLKDIIEKRGNDIFLEIEEQVITTTQNIIKKDLKNVISTGGSVIYNENIMNYLRNLGTIIYLDIDIKVLVKRINNFVERGVVFNDGETITTLYHKRIPLYKKHADIYINNSRFNIHEIGNIISNLL